LVARRDLTKSFGIIGGWSVAVAVAAGVGGAALLFGLQPGRRTFEVAIVLAYVSVTLTYIGAAIWCRLRLPDVIAIAR
ncbi:MAG: hypothetical protein AAF138_11145, partial [Planctomycetota bacterium]